MRHGNEKKLYDFYCKELGRNGGNAIHALESLDWLVFQAHKDEFYALPEEEQMEIRMYLYSIELVHKTNR